MFTSIDRTMAEIEQNPASSTFSVELASNLGDTQIEQLIEIERVCKLSKWSKNDYQTESVREGSVFLIARKFSQERTVIIGLIILRTSNACDEKDIARSIGGEADLLNFGVREEFQRQGIGMSLFENARLILTDLGVSLVWLEVRESNAAAIKFYRARGFRSVQIRRNFYSQPIENALLLKLTL